VGRVGGAVCIAVLAELLPIIDIEPAITLRVINIKKKALTACQGFFIYKHDVDSILFFVLFNFFEVDIPEGSSKTDQNSNNRYKNASSVSYILVKHV
jgi:hypothetical protein